MFEDELIVEEPTDPETDPSYVQGEIIDYPYTPYGSKLVNEVLKPIIQNVLHTDSMHANAQPNFALVHN